MKLSEHKSHIHTCYLTNRPQFSMVFTLIRHGSDAIECTKLKDFDKQFSILKTMLHEASFPATCNATMTNEKNCKLHRTCNRMLHATACLATLRKVEIISRSTFLATCNATFYCIDSCEYGVLQRQLSSQLAMQVALRCKL